MAQTNFVLPTTVIPNSTVGTDWLNPNNILLADDEFAVSGGDTQILTVGNFPINLSQGDSVTNIVVGVKGYRGTFDTELAIYALDNTSGSDLYYPLLPVFQGFDGTNTLYTIDSSLFGTTWTVNQINNIKLQVIANGGLYLDYLSLNVVYIPSATQTIDYDNLTGDFDPGDVITGGDSGATAVIVTDNGIDQMTVTNVNGIFEFGETITGVPSGATAEIVDPATSGATVVDEFVQAQQFQLAQSMTSSDLFCFVSSFNYSDGNPIQIGDFYGDAFLVIDQGVPGKEENVKITNIEHNYNGTQLVRLSFGTINNRGIQFKYPYGTDVLLRQDHSGTAEVVISNSAPFYNRFLKKAQIDALVSAPITVEDEGVAETTSLHTINFTGSGVSVTATDAHSVDVIINGGGGGGGVNSVTSSDDIIDVDNGDPANPVLSLDVVELANDSTFVTELANNSEFVTELTNNVEFQTEVNNFVSGGGGGLGGTQFLAISKDQDDSANNGTGLRFDRYARGRQVLHDESNGRIYVALGPEQDASTTESRRCHMRIFKNTFGNYFQEREITITYTDIPSGGAVSSAELFATWCLSSTNLYAVVKVVDGGGGEPGGVFLLRYDLDGTNLSASTIYTIANWPDLLENFDWDSTPSGGAGTTAQAAVIVGDSLFLNYVSRPTDSDDFSNEFREYDISAFPTITLLNTYTVSNADVGEQDEGHQFVYDSTEDVFLMLGLDDNVESPQITKYQISGSTFVYVSKHEYPEILYGNTTFNTNSNQGYIFGHIVATPTYYTIYDVQNIQNQTASDANPDYYNSWWLETRKYPKF